MTDALGRVFATVLLSSAVWFGAQSCDLLSGPGSLVAGSPKAASPTSAVPPPSESGSPLQRAPSLPAPAASRPLQLGSDFSSAVRQVAEQVKPTVVQIITRQEAIAGFEQAVPQTGVGSGVIYDRAGYILTNNHVIAEAQTLTVALPDGRTYDGKLVGGDPLTDLAVVQIQGENLPVAQLGDSSLLAVGDWVVAIGNALGLEGGPTVTAGVVGALGRSIREPGDQQTGAVGPFLYDLIQTDAAINPGNSGGPLVNLEGQVVGISTLVAGMAESGVQAQGIGFAIAINSAKPIAQQLMTTGRAIHPYLGVQYVALTPPIARQLGVQDSRGVVVLDVVQGSPAERAGLRRLDVIDQIDNQKVVDESTLGRVLSTHRPGEEVTLGIRRDGQRMQVTVTLGERPPE